MKKHIYALAICILAALTLTACGKEKHLWLPDSQWYVVDGTDDYYRLKLTFSQEQVMVQNADEYPGFENGMWEYYCTDDGELHMQSLSEDLSDHTYDYTLSDDEQVLTLTYDPLLGRTRNYRFSRL